MSSLQQMFPFNNVLVKKFLRWKQGDEEDSWRNKAVENLIKTLKRSPDDQYANLQRALNTKSENTPCVAIKKSQDGRLQVQHRKMLPHVMYCRIFRWPDLQSQHELSSLPLCQYPFQRREANKVCINPYHYVRVVHSNYPPVVTPRSASEFANASPPPESPLSPASNYSTSSSQPQQSSPTYFGNSYNQSNNPHLTPIPQPAHHHNSFQQLQSPPHQHSYQQENPNDPLSQLRGSNQQQMTQNSSLRNLQQQLQPQNSFAINNYYPSQSPLSESNWYSGSTNTVGPNGEILQLAESPRQNDVPQFDSQSSPPPGYTEARTDQHLTLMPMDTGADDFQLTNAKLNEEGPEHWCRITYAELNQKIGEPFKGSSQKVIVDGFTNPSIHNRRFSVGVLSNINRNSTIEMTRRAIGKGVCLENNDSQIFVKNLSDASIFFHSKNCNVENQLNQHAVVKIEPRGQQKMFDQKVFDNLVQEAIQTHDGKSYERLFSLTEHCIIKMSFVKGWGSVYQRQDVTSTPCWIEIHLLKPYALIDQYLQHVGRPSTQITSTS